jgi:hypothetical protein
MAADLPVPLLLVLAIFAWFTWRAPFMFFSGDDMMNMYKAWQTPASDLLTSLAAFWKPAYRPLGGVVYRVAYGLFGFHPRPLYCFSWAVLCANTTLLYLLVARIAQTSFHPLVACVIASVHGMYLDLYYSAGTIYDHLSALFCLIAINIWLASGWRSRLGNIGISCVIALLTIAACDSKENAVALPVFLLAAEFLLVNHRNGLRDRVRALVPIALAALVALIFVISRVAGTADLSSNPAYKPQFSVSALINHLAIYLSYLTYGAAATPAVLGVAAAMVVITLTLRSRMMLFGLIWLAAALLPVAFIAPRAGYVLYLPMMGLGIWAADAAWRLLIFLRVSQRFLPACAIVAVTILCVWNARNWPPDWIPRLTPEWVTTRQFSLRYPRMPQGAKMLFITDPFPREAYDLLFNLRLLYHDDSLTADRLFSGMRSQQPPSSPPGSAPAAYLHVFAFRQSGAEPGYFLELPPEWPRTDFTPQPDR